MKKANERLPSGVTRKQKYLFRLLAEAIIEHIQKPCGEAGPCMFHPDKANR